MLDMWLSDEPRFSKLTATPKDLFYVWSMACNYGLENLLSKVQRQLASSPELMFDPKDSDGKPLVLGRDLQGEGFHVGMENVQRLLQFYARRSVLGHGHKYRDFQSSKSNPVDSVV